MNLNDQIAQMFKDLGELGSAQERANLECRASRSTLGDWKAEHIAKAVASGAASGALGGPVGLVAILPDLMWCGRVAAHGCFGIGHILGKEVDYDQNMNLILLLWVEAVEAATTVPIGKVGIKVFGKSALAPAASNLAGKVIAKAAMKGGSKLGAKIAAKSASKATAKLIAKLAAKTGTSWIPLIGGAVSGGINWWLVDSLLDKAEKYYSGKYPYLVFRDRELADEATRIS